MLRWSGKMSVFQKIFGVLVVAIFISNGLSMILSTTKLSGIIRGQILEGNYSTLKSSQLSVSSLVQQVTATVVALSKDDSLRAEMLAEAATPSERIARINRINAMMLRYVTTTMSATPKIAIFSKDGEIFVNWEPRDAGELEALRVFEEEYKTQKADIGSITWELAVSSLFDKRREPAYLLRFTLPIFSGGAMVGLVTLMLPQEAMESLIGFTDRDAHTTCLVDAGGLVLSSTRPELVGEMLPFDFSRPLNERGTRMLTQNGEEMILCYQSVGKFGWVLVDLMPESYVRAASTAANQTLLWGNILCFVVLQGLTLLLARSITLPLKRLTGLMMRGDDEVTHDSLALMGKNEVAIVEKSYYIMRERLDRLMLENQEKERQKRETEIKALQSQIQPHFLFNTLNTIRCSAINHNTEKAAEMVLALSQLLRMTLVKGEALITLEQEIECLQYYTRIMQNRHATRFDIAYDVQEELVRYRVPTLLLQPLVENSLVHGFKHKKEGGKIMVSAHVEGEDAVIRIADNGEGFAFDRMEIPQDKSSFSGIGLGNVEKRIKLYFGESRGVLLTRNDEEWTVVEIRLPLSGREVKHDSCDDS